MQLSIFHLQDQPYLMVNYDLLTEILLTDQLHVLYQLLLFTFQLHLVMV